LPAAIRRALREELKAVAPRRCAAIASAAPRPIRCACWIARWKPTSPSSTRCPHPGYLCEPCRAHFDAVKQFLDDRGIAYEVRPRMVRGLDYYMRTTFEVVHGALGAQNSVLGGGRYDGLAESLGSKVHSPGIGFSIGEDRLVMSVEGQKKPRRSICSSRRWASRPAARAVMARDLRRTGLAVELAEGKLKRAMELANKLGARFTLIVGDNEMAAGRYALKNMSTGEQEA
jgi:histidyl-tRNA synthetase